MPDSSVQQWLDKAAEDERVVEVLQEAGGPWSMAAYHAQQAAEKYIKAALVSAGVAPPKTHDLPQLIGLHPEDAPEEVEEAAAMVSAYAWLTRYPGSPEFDEAQVAEAEEYLALIKSWALRVIG